MTTVTVTTSPTLIAAGNSAIRGIRIRSTNSEKVFVTFDGITPSLANGTLFDGVQPILDIPIEGCLKGVWGLPPGISATVQVQIF